MEGGIMIDTVDEAIFFGISILIFMGLIGAGGWSLFNVMDILIEKYVRWKYKKKTNGKINPKTIKEKIMKFYQHGDVLLKSIKKIPESKKTKKVGRTNKGFVLAEGEATGHHHVITETEEQGVELVEIDGTLYIKAAEDFTVRHEEHKPIKMPKGNYEVGKVQEFDHFEKEQRDVID